LLVAPGSGATATGGIVGVAVGDDDGLGLGEGVVLGDGVAAGMAPAFGTVCVDESLPLPPQLASSAEKMAVLSKWITDLVFIISPQLTSPTAIFFCKFYLFARERKQ
jgi:hypothetical protein